MWLFSFPGQRAEAAGDAASSFQEQVEGHHLYLVFCHQAPVQWGQRADAVAALRFPAL